MLSERCSLFRPFSPSFLTPLLPTPSSLHPLTSSPSLLSSLTHFYITLNLLISLCSSPLPPSFSSGNLDLTGPKQVFKAENNPWVTPIADQFQLGVSHVFEYVRSETYK